MPRNILCAGSTPNRRFDIFLELLPFLKKKWKVDFILAGTKKIKREITNPKKLGIKTFHYSGKAENVSGEIQAHQIYDEDDYHLCHWFDAELEYDEMLIDRRIYLIDEQSSLVKWYLSVKRYGINSSEDKSLVFMQYWQLHNKQSLWFSEGNDFYSGIWDYETKGGSVFCYFEDSGDVRNAIELYSFLKNYLPRREGGGQIKAAENCMKRNNYNALSLISSNPDIRKNRERLRRVIVG